jgi:flagellar basal-body rod protein FlgB
MALDAAGMRQQAIAQNIANANTPGLPAHRRQLREPLGALQSRPSRQGQAPSLAGLANYRPAFELAGAPGEPVALDMEMAALSENTLHQQALLKLLNKHLGLLIGNGNQRREALMDYTRHFRSAPAAWQTRSCVWT